VTTPTSSLIAHATGTNMKPSIISSQYLSIVLISLSCFGLAATNVSRWLRCRLDPGNPDDSLLGHCLPPERCSWWENVGQ
jgi:hypothetical protein